MNLIAVYLDLSEENFGTYSVWKVLSSGM
jgi:hypothetical protein